MSAVTTPPGRSYPSGGYDPDPYNQGPQRGSYSTQQAPPRRRKVWPWVLLAVILVPVLAFGACAALVGGAVSAVDQARQGGTVALGETFTYQDGLALSAAVPTPYDAGNEFIVADNETAYESVITVVNGTDSPVGASLILTNATVNNTPATQVFDEGALVTQDIAPGQTLQLPFRFKVTEGTTGALQIAVTGTFNEPVFFTGQL